MNRLEKYIRDNKSHFDEEPPVGHFERMQQKMNRKNGRIILLQWGISVAASVAIVVLAGIMWQHTVKKYDMFATCENATDMKLCYLEEMNVVAGQIEALTEDFDPWDRQQMMTDVQNIIDTIDIGFENEIPEELSKNQAKAILSDYYRQNLESLEMIAEELRVKNEELRIINYEL